MCKQAFDKEAFNFVYLVAAVLFVSFPGSENVIHRRRDRNREGGGEG